MKSKFFVMIVGVILGLGCARTPERVLSGSPTTPVDLSGDWELNYQLSDRIQENVDLLRLAAMAEARRRQGDLNSMFPLLPSIELIRLAESVSRAVVLEVEQDEDQVLLKRGEDFPLRCRFSNKAPKTTDDPLGETLCGWDGQHLVFHFQLPERLRVVQRVTLSPDREKINIATTVRRGSGQPFTLNRVYTRFDSPEEEFECEFVLGQGRACNKVGSAETESPQP